MSERKSQERRILEHLQSGKSITPLDALSLYGCFRLGGRIYDLKKRGFLIKTETIETMSGAKIASYKLLPSIKEMSGLVHDFTNGDSLKDYMNELSDL